MNPRPVLTAVVGLALIASTTTNPSARTQFRSQAHPPNATLFRVLGKSHLSLVADLSWIRAIAVSTSLKDPADGLSLIHWCDFVTQLDQKFAWPYVLGGLLGPYSAFEKTYNVKEASALLQRGVTELPDDYRLPLYLSYNQLYLDQDPKGAGQTLLRAARIPHAPAYLGQLATRLLAQSDDFTSAERLAAQLEESTDDPTVRALFAQRRLEVARDAALAVLQRAVDAFRNARGQLPTDLRELVQQGFLSEIPKEPLGGRFAMDQNGTVFSTSGERLKAHFQDEGR
jgi:hypothetical protein